MSQSAKPPPNLNYAEEGEIARVLKEYGEEPRARAAARAIVAARPLT
jgi:16S rRNA (cytosine1402-N4)-methyltransferase